jgi:predicted 2-oxoglutarate/Fe(II)-dependent dioxygenase YbiX
MKIEVIPSVLTAQEIDLLLEQVNPKQTAEPMKYFDGQERNYGIKKVQCLDNEIVQQLIARYNLNVESATILYYPRGSRNETHSDNAIVNADGQVEKVRDWTRTAVVFLNKNYIGGELVYPNQGAMFAPTLGTMILASADYEYAHFVKPVVQGERFTLVLRIL